MEYLPLFSGALNKTDSSRAAQPDPLMQNRGLCWRNRNRVQRALSVVEMEFYRNAHSAIYLPRNLSSVDMFKQEPTTKVLPAFMLPNTNSTRKKKAKTTVKRRRREKLFV
uniref:Uncharacterized protein n=1 Tax=Ceratitis capitata TaxID=7213 RepID=W8ALV4_CERCA